MVQGEETIPYLPQIKLLLIHMGALGSKLIKEFCLHD